MLTWLREDQTLKMPRWRWYFSYFIWGVAVAFVYQAAEHDWIGKVLG